jgi:protein gp37
LADVFDNEVDPQWRFDLFKLIIATPNLDWLLLTKRVGNVQRMLCRVFSCTEADLANFVPTVLPNVWLGATVVNQEEADRDIPKLLATPARVRFLSMEPLLGPVDIEPYLKPCRFVLDGEHVGTTPAVDWVIVGGESGKDARPMHPDWVRSLGEQCEMAGVAFHFKQWGEWADSTGRVGINHPIAAWPDGNTSVKVGKVVAGRELDGRTHNEFPKVTP